MTAYLKELFLTLDNRSHSTVIFERKEIHSVTPVLTRIHCLETLGPWYQRKKPFKGNLPELRRQKPEFRFNQTNKI